MRRKIFALLFLLSGLAVFATPAQANAIREVNTHIERTEAAGGSVLVAVSPRAVASSNVSRSQAALKPALPPTAAEMPVPTVLFGADRAFE